MDWEDHNWETLLQELAKGRGVIPVVGPDLLRVSDGSKQMPFPKLLAKRLYEKLPAAERAGLPAEPTLHDLALSFRYRASPLSLASTLKGIHDSELANAEVQLFPELAGHPAPPVASRHPLRLLAEITALPLYVCTTSDGLLARTLMRARKLQEDQDVRGFHLVRDKSNHPGLVRIDAQRDLPAEWEPSPIGRPFLYHLFGRINALAEFDVTEEDHLEMLYRLQSDCYQPVQLIREMRPSQILLLGHPLSDWHSRFFIRLLRGQRLSAREEVTNETLADAWLNPGSEPPHYASLMSFMGSFSETTLFYRSGSPEAFVRELHQRWFQKQAVVQPPAAVAPQPAASDNDLNNDGVFISYRHHDAACAEALAVGLRAANIKVYLDKSKARDEEHLGLLPGSDYEAALKRNVENATFFLPLLSVNTLTGGFFRREWSWANARNHDFFKMPDRCYIRPIIVDESDAGMHRNSFDVHLVSLLGGVPTEAFIKELRTAIERCGVQGPPLPSPMP